MQNVRPLLAAVALATLLHAQNPPKPDASNPFVQKVLAWFDGACRKAADQNGTRKLRPDIERFAADNKNLVIGLDRGFTGAPSGVLAVTWAGEVHAFDLTPDQAKRAGLGRGAATLITSDATETSWRLTPPTYRLDRLQVEGGNTVLGSQEVACSVVCKAETKPKAGKLMVRRVWKESRASTVSFQFLNELPGDGVLRFTVGPLNKAEGDVHFGPTAVVVDLLHSSAEFNRGVIVSNSVAFLLDVQPDLEAFMRLCLKLMDEAIAILGSVKDSASATTARDDFKRFTQRNQAVLEAMDRLHPTPEQDAAYEQKYGAKMNELAQRLGVEVARLEATEYGAAFLDSTEAEGKQSK